MAASPLAANSRIRSLPLGNERRSSEVGNDPERCSRKVRESPRSAVYQTLRYGLCRSRPAGNGDALGIVFSFALHWVSKLRAKRLHPAKRPSAVN
jgi:hypothetical protein